MLQRINVQQVQRGQRGRNRSPSHCQKQLGAQRRSRPDKADLAYLRVAHPLLAMLALCLLQPHLLYCIVQSTCIVWVTNGTIRCWHQHMQAEKKALISSGNLTLLGKLVKNLHIK
jgi:hypothetical protein